MFYKNRIICKYSNSEMQKGTISLEFYDKTNDSITSFTADYLIILLHISDYIGEFLYCSTQFKFIAFD